MIFSPVYTGREETTMNRNRIEGNWKQLKGTVKEKWGKLTNDDLDVIDGKVDQLIGKIQERYGVRQDEAEREVREWREAAEKESTPVR
jgi:uncharacterized protein YjbJ (UPF0337 family)